MEVLNLIIENFLQYRDTSFMSEFNNLREDTGVPKYYSLWDEQNIVVFAPTPDATYDNSIKLYLERSWII